MKLKIMLLLFIILFSSLNYRALAKNGKVINVIDFGAIPDDAQEDTKSFERALNSARSNKVTMLFIPKGTYFLNSIRLDFAISILGEKGTVLKKTANAGKWSRMFVVVRDENEPNGVYGISNIEFDGNLIMQGEYKRFQLEQQHLIFISASNSREERVKVKIDNCFFKNSVADGITVFRNADVKITNCKARDIFRGAFVSNGGNSKISVSDFEILQSEMLEDSGFDIEVIGDGYYGNKKVNIEYNNINLRGKFHISITDGSNFIGRNITAKNTHFYITASTSVIKISNSVFRINPDKKNRIYFPYDVSVKNSSFILEESDDHIDDLFSVFWLIKNKNFSNNRLLFENCNFYKITNNKLGSVFTLETDDLDMNNLFELNNCKIYKGFKNGVWVKRGGRMLIEGGIWDVEQPFDLNSQATKNRSLNVKIKNLNFVNKVHNVVKTNSNNNSKDVIIISELL